MYKVDLHTHSVASPDGGITAVQYNKILTSGLLDFVAITDHDRIDFAQKMHEELGDKIIIGEEITTSDGEIVGLYLTKRVPPNMTALDTVKAIKAQSGIVYIPHPFETARKGIQRSALDTICDYVDIVEVHNGRAFAQNYGPKAAAWAKQFQKSGAASSDAHGIKGIGYSYSIIKNSPTNTALASQIQMHRLSHKRAPLLSLLYPKYHRAIKKLRGAYAA